MRKTSLSPLISFFVSLAICRDLHAQTNLWKTVTSPYALTNNNVFAILEDSLGALWFGTDGGATRFDGKTWETFTETTTSGGLGSNSVRAIIEDRRGVLWFGTVDGGVSSYDGNTWKSFNKWKDGLDGDGVAATLEDSQVALWFGTWNVSRYDGQTWETFRPDN